METLPPTSWRGPVLLYMAVTLSVAMSVVDGDTSSCTPKINMARHQKFDKPPGQSLILKCPMRLCYPGIPNVTWCKILEELCDPVRTGGGIYYGMEEREKDNAVFVLKFESVQINDTGYYRCRAVYKEQQIVGSTVEIVISGDYVAKNFTTVNKTQTDNLPATNKFQTFSLLLYVTLSMGGLCILIMSISLLIYCQKHSIVKQRSSSQDPESTEELKFVARPGSLKKCPQQLQEGALNPMDTNQPAAPAEVTYDNAHLGYKSKTQNASDTGEEDSIVYADLHHNAQKTSYHFEDNCEVEYAAVNLNGSRKIKCNK